MEELRLWLDSYDDIFSDFDSRHYMNRRISEDFIDELKASLKDRTLPADKLILLIPEEMRNKALEKGIAANMVEQMKKSLQVFSEKALKARRTGIKLLTAGILIMVMSSFIAYKEFHGYVFTALKVLFEPAGWFMIWNGLDYLFYDYTDIQKEVNFYKSTLQMGVHFSSI